MFRHFVLFAILQIQICFSQTTWIGPGATWHYDFEELSGTSLAGFFKYSYTGDTLIDGVSSQKIQLNIYEFLTYPTVALYDSSEVYEYYTYVSNDTVYYRNNDQFFVLFDFGASIGDSWIISTTHNGDPYCDDTSKVVVVDTSSIIMNGQVYRTIELETVAGSSYTLMGTFNEKFGLINGSSPYHLFPRENVCDPGIIVEWYYMSFKCYEDEFFPVFSFSSEDCEYLLTHLDLESEGLSVFEIWPNPVDYKLNLNVNEIGTISIYSLSGQLILEQQAVIGNNELNISFLNNGSYLVVFSDESGILQRELFMKN